jgi:predicted site-specific integrase-resolvase
MKPFEHYLTSVEASKYLRIDTVTLRRWRNKGLVKAIKRGNLWFYDWDDITALLTKDW